LSGLVRWRNFVLEEMAGGADVAGIVEDDAIAVIMEVTAVISPSRSD
jgi:hypothetical protein